MTRWVPLDLDRKQQSTHTTRSKKKRTNPEINLVHLPLMQWAKLHPICRDHLIHIPNERKCESWQGHRLSMLGVVAGVSDLLLCYPRISNNGIFYGGFWIELKAPGKKPTKLQITWLNRMSACGYKTGFFDCWETCKNAILDYLNNG